MEEVDWFTGLLAAQLQQGRLQYCLFWHILKPRIGILGNNDTCDCRIGFCIGEHPDVSSTYGNAASASPDNGDKDIKAMGYILVQLD